MKQRRANSKHKYLVTYDAYLDLLLSFAQKHHNLYGLNKTLPIFWFAPLAKKRESTLKYEKELVSLQAKKGIVINRVTAINSINELKDQFKNTCEYFTKHKNEHEKILWFLTLIQNLHSVKSITAVMDELLKCFGDKYRGLAKHIITEKRDLELELLVTVELTDRPHIFTQITNVMDQLYQNDGNACKLNNIILDEFYGKHGESGSYYLRTSILEDVYKKICNDHEFKEVGEICVYSDLENKPLVAIVTLGELGEYVCFKLVNEHDMHCLMTGIVVDIKNNQYPSEVGGIIRALPC